MAFGNWDHFINTAGASAISLEVGNPIVGSGSLAYNKPNIASTDDFGAHSQLDSTFTRGLTKGRIRTLLRVGDGWTDTGSFVEDTGAGIFYMSDTEDITGTGGNFYTAYVARERNTPNLFRLLICRSAGQNTLTLACRPDLGAQVLLDTAASFVTAGEFVIPIQIEWNLDIAGLGGLRHTMSAGNLGDTNFNNLAVVYDFVEPSPLTVASFEGLATTFQTGATVAPFTVVYDQTGVFQLV